VRSWERDGSRPILLHSSEGSELPVGEEGRESSNAEEGAVKVGRERAVTEDSSLDFWV